MNKGFQKLFWGFFLLTFHLNLGSLPIVPPVIAWLIILSGIKNMKEEAPELKEKGAYITGAVMAAYTAVTLFCSLLGTKFFDSYVWVILYSAGEITFLYFLFDSIARDYEAKSDNEHSKDINDFFKVYLIVFFLYATVLSINWLFLSDSLSVILIILAVALRLAIIAKSAEARRWHPVPDIQV